MCFETKPVMQLICLDSASKAVQVQKINPMEYLLLIKFQQEIGCESTGNTYVFWSLGGRFFLTLALIHGCLTSCQKSKKYYILVKPSECRNLLQEASQKSSEKSGQLLSYHETTFTL